MNIRKPFLFTFAVTLGFFAATSALAWTGPSATPPNSNATAPLNVSNTAQSKGGGLILNTGAAATGLVVYGNLGVGTAAPSYKLTVADSSAPTMDLYYTGAAAAGNKGKLLFDYNRSDGSEEELGYIQGIAEGTASNGGMRFVARNGSDVEAMRMTSAGYVGIGTPNPGFKLDVLGTANAWAAHVANTTTASQSLGLYIQAGTNSGDFPLYINNATAATALFYITGAGSTYIGGGINDSAGARMDAAGGWLRTYGQSGWYNGTYGGGFYMTSAGSVTAYNGSSVTASAFYYNSDERLKKNIEAIASSTALQKVLALQPVTFNWIDANRPTTTQIGFIAQQVQNVVPEIVTTDASTTIESVDYARVTPLLVGAIQQQQAEIDELKAEVAALKGSR